MLSTVQLVLVLGAVFSNQWTHIQASEVKHAVAMDGEKTLMRSKEQEPSEAVETGSDGKLMNVVEHENEDKETRDLVAESDDTQGSCKKACKCAENHCKKCKYGCGAGCVAQATIKCGWITVSRMASCLARYGCPSFLLESNQTTGEDFGAQHEQVSLEELEAKEGTEAAGLDESLQDKRSC